MGYAMAFSACCICKQLFAYNPVRAPSVVADGAASRSAEAVWTRRTRPGC